MKIPDRYLKILPGLADEEGNPLSWESTMWYVPPGFLPLSLFELGNGDVCGFYWPVGRETEEPLLCETYHDEGGLEPCASSLEGLTKLKAAEGYYEPEDLRYDDCQEIAEALVFELPLPERHQPPSVAARLLLDPDSPSVLRAAATDATARDEFDQAQEYLLSALNALPEYTAALYDLAILYRRKRQLQEAAQTMTEILSAPLCFGTGRDKCLPWLQRLSDADYPALADDPLWRNRHHLTFATGVKRNDDFVIYEEAVSEYLKQDKGIKAVRLRILIGELMGAETISFRERYDYSMEKHTELLRDNLRKAGLEARLPAVSH